MTPAPADAQPVAWMVTKEGEPMSPCLRTWEGEHAPGWTYTPLYAHPPAAPAQDAPADAISSHPDLCRDDNEKNCPNSANLSAPALLSAAERTARLEKTDRTWTSSRPS